MSIVNFTIPTSLDIRIKEAVKKKGFPSKAELFRYALIKYLEECQQYPIGYRSLQANPRIVALTDEIEKVVISSLGQKKKRKK